MRTDFSRSPSGRTSGSNKFISPTSSGTNQPPFFTTNLSLATVKDRNEAESVPLDDTRNTPWSTSSQASTNRQERNYTTVTSPPPENEAEVNHWTLPVGDFLLDHAETASVPS